MIHTPSKQNTLSQIINDRSLQMQWENFHESSDSQIISNEEEIIKFKRMLFHRPQKQQEKKRMINPLMPQNQQLSQQGNSQKKKAAIKQKSDEKIQNFSQNGDYKIMFLQMFSTIMTLNKCIAAQFPQLSNSEFNWPQIEEVQPNQIRIAETLKNLSLFVNKSLETMKSQQTEIGKANLEITNLTKTNKRLMEHIQQRKDYSETLKQKIAKLKDIITELEQSKRNEESWPELKAIGHRLDIKYMNRNDLIVIIKNLTTKIKNHSQECHQMGIGIDEFQFFESKSILDTLKKSRSSDSKLKLKVHKN